MSTFHPDLLTWMQSHHSTLCSEVIGDAGLTPDQRKALVRDRVVVRLLDGGYHFQGAKLTEEARCAAVCTARPRLVIAGPTAARLWGLRRAQRDQLIHVIAPPFSQPSTAPWMRVYRTDRIRDDQIVKRDDGIRVTSPSRTVIDHARLLNDRNLSSMIEAVLASRLASLGQLERDARWLATPGRPWARHFLDVLGDRTPGGGAESDWEDLVAAALRARGVTGLVRQHRLFVPGYGHARFDVAIPTLLFAVEIDIHPAHATMAGETNDARRDTQCAKIHWSVRRLKEMGLRTAFDREIDSTVEAIGIRRKEVDALRAAGLISGTV